MIKSTKPISGTMTKNKPMAICACGEPNPEHRGYCTNCVRKLKARFDSLILAYEAVKEEYDSFNAIDVEKATEKLKLMRAKADQYEIKLTDAQMMDVMEAHGKLVSTEENKGLAELKVRVQAGKQEQEIMMFKQKMEEEDCQKQQEWFKDRISLTERRKKDLESEAAKFTYEFDVVADEIAAIEKRVFLKKRYVTQHQHIVDAKLKREANAKKIIKK